MDQWSCAMYDLGCGEEARVFGGEVKRGCSCAFSQVSSRQSYGLSSYRTSHAIIQGAFPANSFSPTCRFLALSIFMVSAIRLS